jgi:hypothetical protein
MEDGEQIFVYIISHHDRHGQGVEAVYTNRRQAMDAYEALWADTNAFESYSMTTIKTEPHKS